MFDGVGLRFICGLEIEVGSVVWDGIGRFRMAMALGMYGIGGTGGASMSLWARVRGLSWTDVAYVVQLKRLRGLVSGVFGGEVVVAEVVQLKRLVGSSSAV